ncbi:SpaH/EbpB family LPXTG-anchored major pilin [Enterococcus faecalis]|uniref:SpaH/EbpB family LPXTG-anchored major pilin n=1 Tax=Enterococcus faecalis TaxID=1351 RepID=UPI0025B0F3F5|nr:SpaH/EbpB family LPXTG-anchored major pilin [Enterococcus faecalis]
MKKKTSKILISTIILGGFCTSAISNVVGGNYTVHAESAGSTTALTTEAIIEGNRQGSLTLQKRDSQDHEKPVAGAKFRAYKVMDFKQQAQGADYAVTAEFKNFFTEGNHGGNMKPSDISGLSTSELDSLIVKLTTYAQNPDNKARFMEAASDETGKVSFNPFNLGLGYYLVVETEAPQGYVIDTKSFLVSVPETDKEDLDKWSYDVDVELKNSPNTVTKEVNGGSKDIVEVGDSLDYSITTPVIIYPNDAKFTRFAIKDTMSAGLTFNKDSLKIEVSNDGTKFIPYTGQSDLVMKNENVPEAYLKPGAALGSEKETKTFGVYFRYEDIKSFKQVRINYSAILNKDAVIGVDGNTNSAILEYTNDPHGESNYETEDSPEDKTIVGITGIDLLKVDSKDVEKTLEGAEFTLFREDGSTVVQLFKFDSKGNLVTKNGGNPTITDNKGHASIYGLKEGIYQLKETKSPSGYQLLAKPIKIEITDVSDNDEAIVFEVKVNDKVVDIVNEKGLIQLSVPNNSGFKLPQTGGTGTVFLSVIGLILASVGGISLVKNKKTEK